MVISSRIAVRSTLDASTVNDIVFVGAGHNALVAAAYLLEAGRSVVLLDRMPEPGGWVRTDNLGGFLHDRYSALHPVFVGGPAWAELGPDLRRHGLEYVTAPWPLHFCAGLRSPPARCGPSSRSPFCPAAAVASPRRSSRW
jgi:phytoene dehydrogenase-like protein